MRKLIVVLSIAAFLGCLVGLESCARRASEPVERKMMIIGIDGLEWDVMGPMIEAGQLPHFAKLIHEGTWGEIQSLEQLQSPMIWTSIATGKTPEKHGVTGFKTRAGMGGSLVTSKSRKVKAVWQILGDSGRTVGVVGWLVTWPAEPVNGYLVSDYLAYHTETTEDGGEGMTYPAELAQELAPLRLGPGDVTGDDVARLTRGTINGDPKFVAKLDRLKTYIAMDESSRYAALHLAKTRPVDFFAVYLPGIDWVCHEFWAAMDPESGPPVDAAEAQAFGKTIEKYYEYTDEILGQFLDLAGKGWTVIVTSDHGHSGPKPQGTTFRAGVYMHDPTGVVILWGKDIARQRELTGASVLDITPTILALYGLPVADDMDGKVWVDAIDPGFLEAHPVQRIATYESGEAEVAGEEEPAKSSVDDEVKERLRSLGYIK
jgi:predicted AlkP superfamily phosphohydrolase/phosphomutase